MTETGRYFDGDVVMTAVTGRMVCEKFSDMHALYEVVLGQPVFTHQLPLVFERVAGWLAAQHPTLAEWWLWRDAIDKTNWKSYQARAIREMPAFWVKPMPAGSAPDCSTPIADVVEMVGPEKVIVVM